MVSFACLVRYFGNAKKIAFNRNTTQSQRLQHFKTKNKEVIHYIILYKKKNFNATERETLAVYVPIHYTNIKIRKTNRKYMERD